MRPSLLAVLLLGACAEVVSAGRDCTAGVPCGPCSPDEDRRSRGRYLARCEVSLARRELLARLS